MHKKYTILLAAIFSSLILSNSVIAHGDEHKEAEVEETSSWFSFFSADEDEDKNMEKMSETSTNYKNDYKDNDKHDEKINHADMNHNQHMGDKDD
jgi:hypothetical protein